MEKINPRINELNMFSGKESLKYMASNLDANFYSVRQLFPTQEIVNYTLGRIPFGVSSDSSEIFTLNLNKSNHMYVLGATGDGKTWLMQSIISRFFLAGGKVVVLTDIKGEYSAMSKPLQPEFHKFLLEKEKPQGLPIKVYRPYFMNKLTGINPKGAEICQFTLDDINMYDFYTLLDMENISDSRKLAIEIAFHKIRKGEITNLSQLIKDFKECPEINSTTGKLLASRVKSMQDIGVLGDIYSGIDIIKDINEGKIPIMNLEGFTKIGTHSNYVSTYVAILIRKLLSAKMEGKLKKNEHLCIVIDEAQKFCPNDGNPTSKVAIQSALDLFRSEKGTLIFCTQDYKRMPNTILEQCKNVFIGHSITLSSLKEVVKQKASQEYESPVTFGADMAQIKGMMRVRKNGNRDWLYINSSSRRDLMDCLFLPIAPLNAHETEH